MQPSPAQDHTEVEWQFEAPDTNAVVRWLDAGRVPGFRAVDRGTRFVSDTYFDTPGRRLRQTGYTCRVREQDGACELTLKAMAAAQDGLRRRREVTEPLATAERDPKAAPGPCGDIIREAAGDAPLEPLFTLEQQRRVYELRADGGPIAEVTVDDVRIPGRAGVAPVTFARVEVEVVGGAFEAAKPFVDAFARECGLEPAKLSKFAAGMRSALGGGEG